MLSLATDTTHALIADRQRELRRMADRHGLRAVLPARPGVLQRFASMSPVRAGVHR
jgi:hypothetical protein